MKKHLLLLTSILISTFAFSQSIPSFGVRAGLSSAGMYGNAVNSLNNLVGFANGNITTSNRYGFFTGSYVSIPVSSKVSIEPAVYYSQKGYELRGSLSFKGLDFLGTNAKAALVSQYIDVPILIKGTFNGFQVFAGPQLSYLAKADLKSTAGVLGFNLLNSKTDATSQFNRWDAALTGGVGYQFSNGINLMASYDYGLLKVDANRSVNSYNKALKVGVGFAF